ncbi:MAG TPA: energy transducer TonB [Ignavibacteriaceae bacterium]|nr:energy transducer TonB [Ignavibacteriaceae bacterium]
MKTILLSFLFVIILSGCEKNNSIEVVPSYDSIYLTQDNVDKPPILIKGDEKALSKNIEKSLKNNETIEYKLLLNEKGNVEKIVVVDDPGQKFSDIISSVVAGWQFEPAMKGDKAVKSQYTLNVYLPGKNELNDSEFIAQADVMPSIIGGMYELQKNIKYPEKARVNGVEGKVFVKVFIDEKGNVIKTSILKSGGDGFDEAAINAIRKIKFTPGQMGGKPVKVVIVIPIMFKLS